MGKEARRGCLANQAGLKWTPQFDSGWSQATSVPSLHRASSLAPNFDVNDDPQAEGEASVFGHRQEYLLGISNRLAKEAKHMLMTSD